MTRSSLTPQLIFVSVRARLRRTLPGAVGVVLLVGLTGGFVVASAAAARRSDGAYAKLLKDIDAPDLVIEPSCIVHPIFGCLESIDESIDDAVAAIVDHPAVARVSAAEIVLPVLLSTEGVNLGATVEDPTGCYDGDRSVQVLALHPGGITEQPMPFRLEGRLPAAGERGVVLTRATAERGSLRAGDHVKLAGWCDDGRQRRLGEPIDLVVTGLSAGPLDIEPPGTGIAIELTYVDPESFAAVIARSEDASNGLTVWFDPSASAEEKQQFSDDAQILVDIDQRAMLFADALGTEAAALWILAAAMFGACILVLGPVIARHLRDSEPHHVTLGALGATKSQVGALTVLYAAALGVIASAVAVASSLVIGPRLPRGLARNIEPALGIWLDPLVWCAGGAALIGLMIFVGLLSHAWQWRPARRSSRSKLGFGARFASRMRLAPSEDSGVRAALGSPLRPTNTSPLAGLMALALISATAAGSLSFLGGLWKLEQSPELVGWNWDALVFVDEDADISQVTTDIAAVDGVSSTTVTAGFPLFFLVEPETGEGVWPWFFETGPGRIGPSVVEGRAALSAHEVAINPDMARLTGRGVGDTIELSRPGLSGLIAEFLEEQSFEGERVTYSFEITGIVALPLERSNELAQASLTREGFARVLDGRPGELEAALGSLPADLDPADRDAIEQRLTNAPGDGIVLNFDGNTDALSGILHRVDGVGEVITPTPQVVLTEVVGLNLSRTDRIPLLLGIAMALLGAAVAVHLLVTTTVSRRAEIAVLRSLGMTSGGVRRSALAQSATEMLGALVVGIPVGVVVGRAAWRSYANSIDIVPSPATPGGWLALFVAGAVVIVVISAIVSASRSLRPGSASLLTADS